MPEELIDICDENNELLGVVKPKKEAQRDGSWHRLAHICMHNSEGKILLQLRSKDKSWYPDVWDISSAGHVAAGEEPIHGALREAREELGLEIEKKDLVFIGIKKQETVYNDLIENEFAYVYLYKFDGDISTLTFHDGEVQDARLVSLADMEEELKNTPDRYVARGVYWQEVIDEVRKK